MGYPVVNDKCECAVASAATMGKVIGLLYIFKNIWFQYN